MADDVLKVAFKVDTSGIDADGESAGQALARAFEKGFGTLNLKPVVAKAGEGAQAQAADVGKAVQSAVAAPAGAALTQSPAGASAGAAPRAPDTVDSRSGGAGSRAESSPPPGISSDISGGIGAITKSLGSLNEAVEASSFLSAVGALTEMFSVIKEAGAKAAEHAAERKEVSELATGGAGVAEVGGAAAAGRALGGGGGGLLGEIGGTLLKSLGIGAVAAGGTVGAAELAKSYSDEAAEFVTQLTRQARAAGLSKSALAKATDEFGDQGVARDEFAPLLGAIAFKGQRERASVARQVSNEPLDTADAQFKVAEAYRAREDAANSTADAEQNIITKRAAEAVTLSGAAIRDQIAKESGPMKVLAAQLGLTEAESGRTGFEETKGFRLQDAARAAERADQFAGPEAGLRLTEAHLGKEGAEVNLGNAELRQWQASMRLRALNHEPISSDEQRRFRESAIRQEYAGATQAVREAELGVRRAGLREGEAQLDFHPEEDQAKAQQTVRALRRALGIEDQRTALGVGQARINVRSVEEEERERRLQEAITGSAIPGVVSPAEQVAQARRAREAAIRDLARKQGLEGVAGRAVTRAEQDRDFMPNQQIGKVSSTLFGATDQGVDLPTVGNETLAQSVSFAAGDEKYKDIGPYSLRVLGVLRDLAKLHGGTAEGQTLLRNILAGTTSNRITARGGDQLINALPNFSDESLKEIGEAKPEDLPKILERLVGPETAKAVLDYQRALVKAADVREVGNASLGGKFFDTSTGVVQEQARLGERARSGLGKVLSVTAPGGPGVMKAVNDAADLFGGFADTATDALTTGKLPTDVLPTTTQLPPTEEEPKAGRTAGDKVEGGAIIGTGVISGWLIRRGILKRAAAKRAAKSQIDKAVKDHMDGIRDAIREGFEKRGGPSAAGEAAPVVGETVAPAPEVTPAPEAPPAEASQVPTPAAPAGGPAAPAGEPVVPPVEPSAAPASTGGGVLRRLLGDVVGSAQTNAIVQMTGGLLESQREVNERLHKQFAPSNLGQPAAPGEIEGLARDAGVTLPATASVPAPATVGDGGASIGAAASALQSAAGALQSDAGALQSAAGGLQTAGGALQTGASVAASSLQEAGGSLQSAAGALQSAAEALSSSSSKTGGEAPNPSPAPAPSSGPGEASGSAEGLARGGMIRGAGTGTSDSIPMFAEPGSYILKASATAHWGQGMLDDIEAGRYAAGGHVPVRVSDREYHFTPNTVDSYGLGFMQYLNSAPRYDGGGTVPVNFSGFEGNPRLLARARRAAQEAGLLSIGQRAVNRSDQIAMASILFDMAKYFPVSMGGLVPARFDGGGAVREIGAPPEANKPNYPKAETPEFTIAGPGAGGTMVRLPGSSLRDYAAALKAAAEDAKVDINTPGIGVDVLGGLFRQPDRGSPAGPKEVYVGGADNPAYGDNIHNPISHGGLGNPKFDAWRGGASKFNDVRAKYGTLADEHGRAVGPGKPGYDWYSGWEPSHTRTSTIISAGPDESRLVRDPNQPSGVSMVKAYNLVPTKDGPGYERMRPVIGPRRGDEVDLGRPYSVIQGPHGGDAYIQGENPNLPWNKPSHPIEINIPTAPLYGHWVGNKLVTSVLPNRENSEEAYQEARGDLRRYGSPIYGDEQFTRHETAAHPYHRIVPAEVGKFQTSVFGPEDGSGREIVAPPDRSSERYHQPSVSRNRSGESDEGAWNPDRLYAGGGQVDWRRYVAGEAHIPVPPEILGEKGLREHPDELRAFNRKVEESDKSIDEHEYAKRSAPDDWFSPIRVYGDTAKERDALGYAGGGLIPNIRVSDGEYVFSPKTVSRNGSAFMDMLNGKSRGGLIPGFASGGILGGLSYAGGSGSLYGDPRDDPSTAAAISQIIGNPSLQRSDDLLSRFDFGGGLSMFDPAKEISRILGTGAGATGEGDHHVLDVRTDGGTFRTRASGDMIEYIRSSAVGDSLTSTGKKAGWW